jgi:acetolactate synthase-1/2/3 large subunit
MPIVKHSVMIQHPLEIPRSIHEAFHIARTGRRGPVLVDVPKDIFTMETTFEFPTKVNLPGYRPTLQGNPKQVRAAANVINHAKRPVILAGQGVVAAQAFEELQALAEKAQIPVITTLLGIGGIRETHPLAYGMIGLHGLWHNNYAVTNCDVLIGIGMRFDDRVTRKLSDFAPNAHVVHVDIDPAEISKNVKAHTPIVGDAKIVLQQLLPEIKEARHDAWIDQIDRWREEHPLEGADPSVPLTQTWVIKRISEVTQGRADIVTDVGQHQMWAAQHYTYDRHNAFFSAGGLGAMGFGLPAAMGVQVARPDDEVWALLGDGGFMMTVQEMATIVEENIPVKIIIMNNSALGMIRQWQNMMYNSNYVAAFFQKNPDFVKLAEAFGMPAWRAEHPDDLNSAIEKARAHRGPCLIDAIVTEVHNVFPMVRAGKGLTEMDEAENLRVAVGKSREEY